MRLVPKIENNQLLIYEKMSRSTLIFKRDIENFEGQFLNTTSNLPLAILVLNKFYKTAINYFQTGDLGPS